jgi:Zn-finger nucleic acid-binding protein
MPELSAPAEAEALEEVPYMREVACLLRPEPECPFCDVLLTYREDKGYYQCPNCSGEWWPADSSEDEDISMLWRDEQAYKRSLAKKGGSGSRNAGRKKATKPLITERYRLK